MDINPLASDSLADLIMTDRCLIREPANRADGVYDPVAMTTTYSPGAEVYRGRCALEIAAADRVVDGILRERIILDLPLDATLVRLGHIVVLVDANNRELEDRQYRVARPRPESAELSLQFELELSTQAPTAAGA